MSFDIYTKSYKKFGNQHPKAQCCSCYNEIDLTRPPIIMFDCGMAAYYYCINCAKKICEEFLKDIKEAEAQVVKEGKEK